MHIYQKKKRLSAKQQQHYISRLPLADRTNNQIPSLLQQTAASTNQDSQHNTTYENCVSVNSNSTSWLKSSSFTTKTHQKVIYFAINGIQREAIN
jgi:hypothetical protein